MILPQKKIERNLLANGYQHIVAVDEVGMGALAGPVVVCAVMFDKKFFQKTHKNLNGLRDSKLLSPKKRGEFAAALFKDPSLKFKISLCYPKTIDRINIYRASRLAMRRATLRLHNANLQMYANATNKKIVVLVDGPHKIKGLGLDQIPVVKGDRKVFSIACASIIAKVTRDKMMVRYAKHFPDYGFERHKGYGTQYHRTQLAIFGPSQIHRFSFAPIAGMR